jgi:hypothetical protein
MIENKLEYKDNTTETLFFSVEDHKYYWNEEQIASVTTVLKNLTPATPLVLWSAKMSAEKFKTLVQAGQSYDEIKLLDYYNQIKNAHKESLNQSGVIGTFVHDAIENYVHHKELPTFTNEQMNKSFNKFKEWFDTQDELEIVFTERRLLSRIHKICGTVDAVFKNKKTGKHIVYDWKTSSGIRDSYYVQLYWYKMILCEMYDMEIDKGVIVNCTKDGKLKIAEFDIDSQCEDIAISSLKLYRFKPNQKKESK